MGERDYMGAVDIVLTAEECRTIVAALRSTYLPGEPFNRWELADRVAQAIDDAAYHSEATWFGADRPEDATPEPVAAPTGWPYPVPAVLWDAITDAVASEVAGGMAPAGWTPDRTVAIRWAQRGYVDGAENRIGDPCRHGTDDDDGTADVAYWAGYNLARDHAMGVYS